MYLQPLLAAWPEISNDRKKEGKADLVPIWPCSKGPLHRALAIGDFDESEGL